MTSHRYATPTILYQDEWLLAVDKPAGVKAVPGRGSAPTVAELLLKAHAIAAIDDLRIVHRLDVGTSGVMVLGKSRAAQQALSELWTRRKVDKVYLALVRGYVAGDGEIDLPLLVDRDRQRVVPDERRGKPAITGYRVLERVAGHTLLECRPLTGRLHQIRVHLAAIGHPLGVDPLYGACEAIFLSRYKPGYRPSRRHEERPLIARLTLHAASVGFEHPAGTRLVTISAPVPKDFRAALQQLRRLMPEPVAPEGLEPTD